MDVPHGYVGALALTLAVEVPVYGGLGARGLVAGVVGNLVTHPLIFIVLPIPAVVGEPVAWLIEVVIAAAIVRDRRRFEDVLMVVLAANVLSLMVGTVVGALF